MFANERVDQELNLKSIPSFKAFTKSYKKYQNQLHYMSKQSGFDPIKDTLTCKKIAFLNFNRKLSLNLTADNQHLFHRIEEELAASQNAANQEKKSC